MLLYKLNNTHYRLVGDSLVKALQVGATKNVNGKTYRLNQNHRWQSTAKHLVHSGEHLAQNVVAWKAGKIVGGAIAQAAAAHGIDPMAAQILSESVVQAGAATAIFHAQSANQGTGSPTQTAAYFVTQISAAILGKVAHHGAEDLLTKFHAEDMYTALGSLMAGKGTGIGVVASANKTKIHEKAIAGLLAKGRHDLNLVTSLFGGKLAKDAGGLSGPESDLLWTLTQIAVAMAAWQLKHGS